MCLSIDRRSIRCLDAAHPTDSHPYTKLPLIQFAYRVLPFHMVIVGKRHVRHSVGDTDYRYDITMKKVWHIVIDLSPCVIIPSIPFILLGIIGLGCLLLYFPFEAEITKFRARNWVESTHQDVLSATEDAQVVLTLDPDIYVSGTMGCIRGSSDIVFRTSRSYEDVVAFYETWLLARDWQSNEIPDNAHTWVTHLYYIPDDKLSRTVAIMPLTTDLDAMNNETVYAVVLYFTELRCTDFCPGWRCPKKPTVTPQN